jgi:hypothetical protein
MCGSPAPRKTNVSKNDYSLRLYSIRYKAWPNLTRSITLIISQQIIYTITTKTIIIWKIFLTQIEWNYFCQTNFIIQNYQLAKHFKIWILNYIRVLRLREYYILFPKILCSLPRTEEGMIRFCCGLHSEKKRLWRSLLETSIVLGRIMSNAPLQLPQSSFRPHRTD